MNTPRDDREYEVLIIDDESDVRQLLSHLLDRDAFAVETVESGQEGLDYLRDPENGTDVVILDISMPKMDGFETLKRIQEMENPPLTMVLSSRDNEDDQIRAFNLGAIDYVTKPFSSAVIVARLQRHIEREEKEEPFSSFPSPWTSAKELIE